MTQNWDNCICIFSCIQGVPATLPNSLAPQIYWLALWHCCGTSHTLRTPSSPALGTPCTACVVGLLPPPWRRKAYRAHPTPSEVYQLSHSALCRWYYTVRTVKGMLKDHWWTVSILLLQPRVSRLWSWLSCTDCLCSTATSSIILICSFGNDLSKRYSLFHG